MSNWCKDRCKACPSSFCMTCRACTAILHSLRVAPSWICGVMHVTAWHVTAWHVTAWHVKAWHVTARHVTARHVTAWHVIAWHTCSCLHISACWVQVQLEIPVTAAGICNAIAFWFELHLDEETHLSTSPYSHKVTKFLLYEYCMNTGMSSGNQVPAVSIPCLPHEQPQSPQKAFLRAVAATCTSPFIAGRPQ